MWLIEFGPTVPPLREVAVDIEDVTEWARPMLIDDACEGDGKAPAPGPQPPSLATVSMGGRKAVGGIVVALMPFGALPPPPA